MEKPTSMIIEELNGALTQAVNDAKLPACVSAMVVAEFNRNIQSIAAQISNKEKGEYVDFLDQQDAEKKKGA